MRRYSWTKHTMVVAEVGGPYVTFTDHQRAIAAKDAEIAELRSKLGQPTPCPECVNNAGANHHCTHFFMPRKIVASPVVHSQGSHCDCDVCSRKPASFFAPLEVGTTIKDELPIFKVYDIRTECPCCTDGFKGWLFKRPCDFCKGTGLWPRNSEV